MVRRGLVGGVVLVMAVLGVAGCSDGAGTASDVASKAASAVKSVGGEVSSAAASAAAVAKQKLDEIKDGVDAKGDVTLGTPSTDGDGYAVVPVTVKNTDSSKKSFAVQVNFKDESGNRLDTVVVTINDVAGNASGQGTARSTQKPSGTVTVESERALRY